MKVILQQKLEQRLLHFNISKSDQTKSTKRDISRQQRFEGTESTELNVEGDTICEGVEEPFVVGRKIEKLDVAYRCEACNISCPDANTLALHLAGKRHRNRLKRMEENDCEATLQALGVKEPQKSAANSSLSSPQWGKASRKESTRTFQEILAEEERASMSKPAPSPLKQSRRAHKITTASKTKQNMASRTAKISRPGVHAVASPSVDKAPTSFLLSDLLEKQKQPKVTGTKKDVTDHPWGKRDRSNSVSEGFQNILREEENRKTHEDTRGVSESKWFLEQRERASSFSALQKADEEERELQRLIEEQRQIEAQIEADNAQKKKELELSRRNRKQRKQKQRRNKDEQKSPRNKRKGSEKAVKSPVGIKT
uniref:C2H2-type domain-containing protein n=1 Tax=Leptocylindrus danicus TaxID=163516 RepID=A0A7S2KB95_9STRA